MFSSSCQASNIDESPNQSTISSGSSIEIEGKIDAERRVELYNIINPKSYQRRNIHLIPMDLLINRELSSVLSLFPLSFSYPSSQVFAESPEHANDLETEEDVVFLAEPTRTYSVKGRIRKTTKKVPEIYIPDWLE